MSKFTNIKRAFSFAVADFYRNRGLSLAAIFVLTITTLLITGLFFMNGISNYLVQSVQDKIDITAYFKNDTAESDILVARDNLLAQSIGIKNIEYISQEQALADFTAAHQDNQVFLRALTEVGENPFLPALNITTTSNDVAEYQKVADILQEPQYAKFIEKVDFSQKKDTIKKVFSVTRSITLFGWAVAVVLGLVVLAVVFNTMKLVIDASKEEINTMRIVGASSWFVRAPFIIEGALFGFVSFVVCFAATVLLVYVVAGTANMVLPGFNLGGYFFSNLWLVVLIQLATGVGLGGISSFIVVRKYLKV